MGLKMHESSSSESGSQELDKDIDLLDQPTNDKHETENSDQEMDEAHTERVSLENAFDQDDSDEEFSSSGTSNNLPSSPPAQSQTLQPTVPPHVETESYSDPNLMLQFYSRLFPFQSLFLWLNHSAKPGPDFGHREFALTLPNDAYLRYQSYQTAAMLKKDILRLNPSRFEIGPVYTTNPRDRKTLRKSTMFKPLSKEIVFDIDLTDYDDIRSCCTKANICSKCWTFATMAIKVIDVALREDFGFEHIIWVYSGRRGVHAWISDKEARELDDDKRKAITGYFEVLKGGVQGGKRVNIKRPLHPHLTRSLDILKPYFQQNILVDQEPFLSQAGQDRLLQLLPDKTLTEALRKKWSGDPDRSSVRKWADIDALAATGISKTLDTKALMEAKQDILLEYTYPRLDVEVGKKRIHLLKSPFVVHPGTGRVCVPITMGGDMKRAEDFDPLNVPTVTELLREVDKNNPTNGGLANSQGEEDGNPIRKVNDWERTSLKPYCDLFDTFIRSLLKSEMSRVKREREEDGITGADGMEF